MFERFTRSARRVVLDAQNEAQRSRHRQIATPHLLLALLGTEAGGVLRDCGVTREAIERELGTLLQGAPRLGGKDPGEGDVDDAQMLAALGIDLDRIREAVESTFGPGALGRAQERAADGAEDRPHGLLARLAGTLRRSPGDEVTALRGGPRRTPSHIPFSPAAKKALELSLREAIRLGDRHIDADHLVLGLLRGDDGLAAVILARLGIDLVAVRAVLEGRHRRSA